MVADVPAETRKQETQTMAKIRLDGVDYEASEQLAQAITVAQEKQTKHDAELKAKVDEQGKQLEALKARADSATDDAKKAKERADAAEKPEHVRDAVKARVELERKAAAILGAEIKLDTMGDADIKRAVVTKLYPSAKLDGQSEVYVQARFDAALEAFAVAPNAGLAAVRAAAASAAGAGANDAKSAREKYHADVESAWQKPLAAHKD